MASLYFWGGEVVVHFVFVRLLSALTHRAAGQPQAHLLAHGGETQACTNRLEGVFLQTLAGQFTHLWS